MPDKEPPDPNPNLTNDPYDIPGVHRPDPDPEASKLLKEGNLAGLFNSTDKSTLIPDQPTTNRRRPRQETTDNTSDPQLNPGRYIKAVERWQPDLSSPKPEE